ncbi:dirigent protein 22-like [Primulina huaijiensis]|uniref:dirigent protein 22-like n=1 Tax=Primulina huaijiensis TaxID=1492673 RepID=UPI003CC79306
MAKFKVIVMFILCSVIHAIVASSQGPQPVDKWFQNLKNNKQVPKTEIIQVYIQDIFGGPGQTVYEIARSNITAATSFGVFGQLFMIDNLLTAGPDPSSKPLGRAQGLVGFSDLNELVVYVSFNIYFRGGPYDGSTISVFGRNPLMNAARELSIVGGTGVFRLARGVAVSTTYMDFNATGYGILKYIYSLCCS